MNHKSIFDRSLNRELGGSQSQASLCQDWVIYAPAAFLGVILFCHYIMVLFTINDSTTFLNFKINIIDILQYYLEQHIEFACKISTYSAMQAITKK